MWRKQPSSEAAASLLPVQQPSPLCDPDGPHMFHNPIQNSSFVRVALCLMAAFLILAAGALHRERRRRRGAMEPSLIPPVATAAGVTFALLFAIFAGGLVLVGVAAIIAAQGLNEYARFTHLGKPYIAVTQLCSLTGISASIWASLRFISLFPFATFLFLTLVPIVSGRVEHAHREVSTAIFGYILIGFPMTFMVFIRTA